MERVDEAYAIRRYQQAAALLPLRWQRLCRQVPEEQQAEAEELRLRAGQTLTLLLRGGEVPAARKRTMPARLRPVGESCRGQRRRCVGRCAP